MKLGASFGYASGPSHQDCHGLAYRFDAAVGFAPDRAESWVVGRNGDVLSVLYGKRGWLTGLWRSPSGKVFVTDAAHRVYLNPDPRPRAAPWQHFDLTGTLEGVFGLDDEHVYVWGRKAEQPLMLRWDGTRWNDMPSPGFVVSVHGTSPELLVAVGERGLLSRWDGGAWRAFAPLTERTLSGVFVASEDEIMACGKASVLLRGSVHGWSPVLDRPDLTGSVAKWRDRWWVGAGTGLGLCLLEDDRLVSHKPKIMPTTFDARHDLLCASPGSIASSSDGEDFRGVGAAAFLKAKTDKPLWL